MVLAAIASSGAVLCTMYDPGEDKGKQACFNRLLLRDALTLGRTTGLGGGGGGREGGS